jgi:hypothetical protein
MTRVAVFTTVCRSCGRLIRKGDQICYLDEYGFVHAECPEDKIGSACPKCHIIRALDGSCECENEL